MFQYDKWKVFLISVIMWLLTMGEVSLLCCPIGRSSPSERLGCCDKRVIKIAQNVPFYDKWHHGYTIHTPWIKLSCVIMQVHRECSTNCPRPTETILSHHKGREPIQSNGAICILNGNALLVCSIWLSTGALMGLGEQFQPIWASGLVWFYGGFQ